MTGLWLGIEGGKKWRFAEKFRILKSSMQIATSFPLYFKPSLSSRSVSEGSPAPILKFILISDSTISEFIFNYYSFRMLYVIFY